MAGHVAGGSGQSRRIFADIYTTLALLALIVLAQATLVARIRFLGACPNLPLVAVATWSLLAGFTDGIQWGFIGGLGLDLVAGMPLGTSSLALMATCFLAGLGKSSIFAGNLALPVVIVSLATPVYGWIVLLTQQLYGTPVDWIASTVRVIGPELVLNALLTVPIYPLLRWLAFQTGAGRSQGPR